MVSRLIRAISRTIEVKLTKGELDITPQQNYSIKV